MPRSFLVKKHLSNKKPNYGALDSKLKEVLPSPKTRHASYPPPSLEPPTEPGLFFDSPSSPSSLMSPPALRTSPPLLPEHCTRTATEPHRLREPCRTTEHFSRTPTGCCKTTEPRLGALIERCETTDNYPKTPADRPTVPDQCLDCHMAYSPFSGLAPCHPLNSDWPSQASSRPMHGDWPCQRYFSCKWCDKGYVSLGALKMHIRTHTLPCVCKLCGKAFSRPWLLQGHIRTHTGEKPFSCPHCSRAFADRSNLRAHLQTHSELKRYQCSRCSKTFSRVSLLAKHHETGCCAL